MTPPKKKPVKPYDGFPLYAHASGHWAKKILGRTRYFGRFEDGWQAALTRFQNERDSIYAGGEPRNSERLLPVGDALDLFLSAKKRQVDDGELNPKTYGDYHSTCKIVADCLGPTRSTEILGADDFERLRSKLAKKYGPVRLSREITQVRMIFRYCFEAGHLERPVRFGPQFKAPKRRELRLARQQNGLRYFEAKEVDALIAAAKLPVKAMILLGVNCGFGNHDCGQLEFSALNLAGGWHNMPRPKTGIQRRAKLWPETVEAIREAIASRPECDDKKSLVFLTKYRQSWHKETYDNPLSNEFRKLLDQTGLYRRGRTFYALRHTFETVAGESRDQVAVDYVMGHLREDMATNYRWKIGDERLEAIAETVRNWWKGV